MALQNTLENDLVRLVGIPKQLGTECLGEGQKVGKLSAKSERCLRIVALGILSLILTTVVIEVPVLANAFELVPIGLKEYGIALALAITIIPIVEIVKLIQRAVAKKKA